jgi:hypothetical protein
MSVTHFSSEKAVNLTSDCTMREAGREEEGLPVVPVLHVVIPVPLASLNFSAALTHSQLAAPS